MHISSETEKQMKQRVTRVLLIVLSAVVIALACAAVLLPSFLEKTPPSGSPETAAETDAPARDTASVTERAAEPPESADASAPSETGEATETGAPSETDAPTEPASETAAEPPVEPVWDRSFGTKTDSAERAAGQTGSSKIVIDFAGDVMIANNAEEDGEEDRFDEYAATHDPSYFLSGVAHIFESDDFTVVNLENVFTDRDLDMLDKGYSPAYWYRAPSERVAVLTSSSVEAVTIANNHTGDFGPEGYADTAAILTAAGIEFGGESKELVLEKDGFRIAMICCGMWNEGNVFPIVDRIRTASANTDYQIVYYHGGTEYQHSPEEWKIRACKTLVEAGADCVIGSHPHVIQPVGRYRGVDIVYSLGNFLAGDFIGCENRTFIYRLTINLDGNTVLSSTSEVIPCYVYSGEINDFRPVPISDPTVAAKVVDFIDWKADSPE